MGKKSQIGIFLRITSTMKFKTMVHLKQDHSLAPSLSICNFLYLAPCLCLLDLSSNGVVNSSFQFLITFFATSLLPFENRHMCAHERILRNSSLLNWRYLSIQFRVGKMQTSRPLKKTNILSVKTFQTVKLFHEFMRKYFTMKISWHPIVCIIYIHTKKLAVNRILK